MSILMHIIEAVGRGERVTEDWLMLRNAYFRGDTGLKDMKEWAEENDMIVYWNEESQGNKVIIHSVTFAPKQRPLR